MKRKTRFKFQAFTSTISCTLVLLLIGLTILIVQVARNVNESMHENFIITLTLGGSNDAMLGTDEGMNTQVASLQRSMKAERYAKDVKLISADEVLQQQLTVIGGNPEEFLGFNPYYSELEVGLKPVYANSDSLRIISKEITAKYPLVSEVNYEKDLVDGLNTNVSKITFILLALTALLLIILLTLIHNMVRLSIYARRFHIHTMKLVGASWWFIRRPFMMRSFWIGLIAGILANAILVGIAQWLVGYDELFNACITLSDLLLMGLTVMLTGLLLLLLCTYVSVNHFLRMNEKQMFK